MKLIVLMQMVNLMVFNVLVLKIRDLVTITVGVWMTVNAILLKLWSIMFVNVLKTHNRHIMMIKQLAHAFVRMGISIIQQLIIVNVVKMIKLLAWTE